MKLGVHPLYQRVLFVDTSTGDEWTSYSTMTSGEKRTVDGQDLQVIKVEISSHSHPFWTGRSREVDAEGRIDRFRRRFAGKTQSKSSKTS